MSAAEASGGAGESALRSLADAVDDAYLAFARYAVGTIAFEPHTHRRTRELVAALVAPNRRTLDEIAIATFFYGFGGSVKADLATFKALLPRMLALAMPGVEEIAHFSVAFIGNRLISTNWQSWPANERAAIEAWGKAWFEATLAAADPHGTVLEDVLCALGTAYDDLGPFLTRLHAATEPHERKQIAHVALSICFTLARARAPRRPDASLVGSYWWADSRSERQMLTWLATQARHERLVADATTGGCDCDWVLDSTADEIDAVLDGFAVGLAQRAFT
ncbi:MAG: hypothetical protein NVSMB19_00290 [Vulcanimicrobiaceae bacterium]